MTRPAAYIDPRTVNECVAGIESGLHTMRMGYEPEALEKWINRLADTIETGLDIYEMERAAQ